MKREKFKAKDGKEISICVWEAENPKGILQISHGMSEHIARYDKFACFMNKHGYTVVGDDHRAHGQTDPDRLGLAEEGKDLFESTVSDMSEITEKYGKKYGLPVVLLGHSYGSFLSQEYIINHSDLIKGCILSGSALYSGFVAGFGKTVAGMKAKNKPDEPGKFFADITFTSYDKKVKEGLNGWLSRNKESNAKYNEDKFCGFLCSNGFYRHFFTHLSALSGGSFEQVRKDLPLMIAYGSEDDVGERGKLITPLVNKYKACGITPEVKAYPGARHEILNETNAEEVFNDMLAFTDRCLS